MTLPLLFSFMCGLLIGAFIAFAALARLVGSTIAKTIKILDEDTIDRRIMKSADDAIARAKTVLKL